MTQRIRSITLGIALGVGFGVGLAFVAAPAAVKLAIAADDGTVEGRFREVSDLRSRGEFDNAIDVLTEMIREYSDSGDVLRHAYNQLVWTMVAKSDDLSERVRFASDSGEQSRLREEQDAIAGQLGEVIGNALIRFPDIRAGDDVPDPSRVNQMYEPTRQRMFGNLIVESEPDSAAVWVNDGSGWKNLGFTPLRRSLYPVGIYELRLSKEGHKERDVASRVGPNETTRHDVTLPRSHDRMWWITRVGLPATAAVAIATYFIVSGDEGGPAEPEPLPGPPDPPASP